MTKSCMSRAQPPSTTPSFVLAAMLSRKNALACTISITKVLQISPRNHVTDDFQRVFASDRRQHKEACDPISDLTTDGNWRDCNEKMSKLVGLQCNGKLIYVKNTAWAPVIVTLPPGIAENGGPQDENEIQPAITKSGLSRAQPPSKTPSFVLAAMLSGATRNK